MVQRFLAALLLCLAVCTPAFSQRSDEIRRADLPPEARTTLQLIEQGGPFPFDRDGVVFGNYEQRLPVHQRGYYHEYTVPTPGARNRGARRIVTGRQHERYYSPDHYKSFRLIIE